MRRPVGAQEPHAPGRRSTRSMSLKSPWKSQRADAQAHRHFLDPDHRRRPDRHRPGGRVRLFGQPGGQGAEGRGLSGHRRQFEPGDDHDRPELADATYIEPITPEIVAKIIEKERPDALLPTMGGQTALNTALALFKDGTLDRLGVELIGANAEAIEKAEDRQKFREAMDKIGLESPRSAIAHIDGGGAGGAGDGRACRRSSARASRSAGPAAASPTTATSSSRSSARGLEASPDHRGADRGIAARLEGI